MALVYTPIHLYILGETLALVGGLNTIQRRVPLNISHSIFPLAVNLLGRSPSCPSSKDTGFFGNGTPGMARAWLWLWPRLVDEPFMAVPGVEGRAQS